MRFRIAQRLAFLLLSAITSLNVDSRSGLPV